ncbi:MAG: hypothetical protein ABJC04_11505 [Verrucomicrobiota bacterium]
MIRSSLRDLKCLKPKPTVETVGYCRVSLWDKEAATLAKMAVSAANTAESKAQMNQFWVVVMGKIISDNYAAADIFFETVLRLWTSVKHTFSFNSKRNAIANEQNSSLW